MTPIPAKLNEISDSWGLSCEWVREQFRETPVQKSGPGFDEATSLENAKPN